MYTMLKYRLFQVASAVTALSLGITMLYLGMVIWDVLGKGRYFAGTFFIALFMALLMFAHDWHKKPVKPKI